MNKITLRGKLILASWLFAFSVALVLTLVLHANDRRHLLAQLETTLESKCDEVVTVLRSSGRSLPVEHFFRIETDYRHANPTYFYQITDDAGGVLARSENLGNARLAIPDWSTSSDIHLSSSPHPTTPGKHVRLRSERVHLALDDRADGALVIQTAGSLEAFELASRETLGDALLVGVSALTLIFLLLSFVATRCLRPVTAMTLKASQITAANLPERLPLSGTGDELDQLATVINDMLERVARSLRQVEQFSSDAAHQLRTPLTRIRVTLDVILRSEDSIPLRSDLEAIRQESDRLSRLCRRLLLLAQLEIRRPEAIADAGISLGERVDLDSLTSELVDQLTPLALENGITLTLEKTLAATEGRAEVPGNRALISEALFNLLENAVQATPDGGSIGVSIEAGEHETSILVRDDGPGVPVEERERIFDRFYRVSPDNHEHGTGLGLAIVSGIAKAHGGRVEVVDAPARGAVFRLVLPS